MSVFDETKNVAQLLDTLGRIATALETLAASGTFKTTNNVVVESTVSNVTEGNLREALTTKVRENPEARDALLGLVSKYSPTGKLDQVPKEQYNVLLAEIEAL